MEKKRAFLPASHRSGTLARAKNVSFATVSRRRGEKKKRKDVFRIIFFGDKTE